MRKLAAWRRGLCVGALSVSLAACGGEIVGIGNNGTFVAGGTLEEVARVLADHPETPQVADEVLAEIFSAILGRAKRGDPEAALIVLRVAEKQREDAEE